MAKMNIKTDDTVIVLSGDDKGTKGKVIATSPKEGKVIVEGTNVVHHIGKDRSALYRKPKEITLTPFHLPTEVREDSRAIS